MDSKPYVHICAQNHSKGLPQPSLYVRSWAGQPKLNHYKFMEYNTVLRIKVWFNSIVLGLPSEINIGPLLKTLPLHLSFGVCNPFIIARPSGLPKVESLSITN